MKKLNPKTRKFLKIAGGAYLLSRLFSSKPTTAKPAINYPINYPTALLENAEAIPTNKKPLGLIMWEGFHNDHWNNPNSPYDKLVNQASSARVKLSRLKEAGINLVPFYGRHTAPENITVYTNIVYNDQLGRNTYDTETHTVTVDFDYTQAAMDAQIQYAIQGGISFLAIDHYALDSPMSWAYQYFVNSQVKGNLKFCFYWPSLGWPNDRQFNLNYIATQMTKPYYFRTNGKPVLFVNQHNLPDIQSFRNAYAAAGGQGEIYFVYSDFVDIPKDGNYQAYGFQAGSNYLTVGNGQTSNHLHSGIVAMENERRADFLKTTPYDLVATITTGFGNYQKLNPFDRPGYTNPGTDQEIKAQLNNALIFAANSSRVPFLVEYAGSENVESARPYMPIKLPNGSLDTSMVNLHRQILIG